MALLLGNNNTSKSEAPDWPPPCLLISSTVEWISWVYRSVKDGGGALSAAPKYYACDVALHACLALSSHCQWLLIPLDHAMDCLEIEMRRITWMNISRCACKHLSKLFVPLCNSRPTVIPVINSFPHSLSAAYCFPLLFHSSPISVWTFITESL